MNVCVKCRHHKKDHEGISTGPRSIRIEMEHYCYSPGVCQEYQKPVTGIPSQKLCSEANENGECKHWEEGETVPLEEFSREKERLKELIAARDRIIDSNKDELRQLRQRRWWRRGR